MVAAGTSCRGRAAVACVHCSPSSCACLQAGARRKGGWGWQAWAWAAGRHSGAHVDTVVFVGIPVDGCAIKGSALIVSLDCRWWVGSGPKETSILSACKGLLQ